MEFDTAGAVEFDPTGATETSSFDPTEAVEFDASGAVEVQPGKTQPKAQIDIQYPDNRSFFEKHLNNLTSSIVEPIKDVTTGTAAAIPAAADLVTSSIGIPVAYKAYTDVLNNTKDFKKAHDAFQTAVDWTSFRNVVKHYGEKLGADPKDMEKVLYSPNFIDKGMEWLMEKFIEPSTQMMGYEEKEDEPLRAMGKQVGSDALMLFVGSVFSKIIPKRAKDSTGAADEIRDIAANRASPLEESLSKFKPDPVNVNLDVETLLPQESLLKGQKELLPQEPQQLEMQFGDPASTAKLVDDPPSIKEIDTEFDATQQVLPLEEKVGQSINEDLFAPLRPDKPDPERWATLPPRRPGSTADVNITTKELKELKDKLGPGHHTYDEMYAAIDDIRGVHKQELKDLGFKGPGKNQGGWIKIPRIFESSPKSVKESIDSQISPHMDLSSAIKSELAKGIAGKPMEKDIGAAWGKWKGNTVTVNQLSPILSSPTITHVITQVRRAYTHRGTNAHRFAQLLKDFDAGISKDDGLKVLEIASTLQKNKYQTAGKASGTPEPTDGQLITAGLRPELIGTFRKLREINKEAFELLKEARKDLDGKDLETPVWAYHPRSRGIGNFPLAVFDKATQQPVFYHRFPTYEDMATHKKMLEEDLQRTNEFHKYEIDYKAESKDWSNPFADINSIDLPEVIRKILENIEEKIETRKRTFEMQRAVGDIGGMILKDGPNPDKMLKDVWLAYLKNVIEFRKNVDLYKLQREVIDHSYYFKDKKNTHHLIQSILQTELGADISWGFMKGASKAADSILNEVAKTKLRLKGKLLDKNDFVIRQDAVRDGVKFGSAVASAGTLLFNTSNAIVNGVQLPLTGIVGGPIDMIGRLRANPAQLAKWTVEMQLEMGAAALELLDTFTTGKATPASKAIDKYHKQGLLRPQMFDEISELAEGYTDTIGRKVARGMAFGKKWTNDTFIELPVNSYSFLYYDILVNKVAKRHLEKSGITKAQMEELPHVLARSWVGEYAKWSKPLYLKKMGLGGDATSNFANWPHNQWGRFVEAVQNVKPEEGKSAFTALGFVAGLWYIQAQLAGGKGAPILSTLETIRNEINSHIENPEDRIPDVNYYAKEYGIPEYIFPQDETILDKAQSAMGIENPMDLSSGQRFANPAQLNTITPEFWWGMAKTIKMYMNMKYPESTAWGNEKAPVGVTRKQVLGATDRLPSLLKGFINQEYATLGRPDALNEGQDLPEGTKARVNKYSNLKDTQTPDEELMNRLGIKSSRQRREQEKIQHNAITRKKLESEPAKLKAHIKNQLIEYLDDPETSFADEAIIMENVMRLEQTAEWPSFKRDMETTYGKAILLPEESLQLEAGKSKQADKLKRLKKMFDRLGLYD